MKQLLVAVLGVLYLYNLSDTAPVNKNTNIVMMSQIIIMITCLQTPSYQTSSENSFQRPFNRKNYYKITNDYKPEGN